MDQLNIPMLVFPIVYLDSSYVLRTKDKTIEKITHRLCRKHPLVFEETMNTMVSRSNMDSLYYKQLTRLLQRNVISYIVSFEALCDCFPYDQANAIPLLRTQNHKKNEFTSTNPHQSNAYNGIVLWGERIDYKTYMNAATCISNAHSIVVDPAFLSISVGTSLTKYIPSSCNTVTLGNPSCRNNNGDNYDSCKLSPYDFIQYLYSVM